MAKKKSTKKADQAVEATPEQAPAMQPGMMPGQAMPGMMPDPNAMAQQGMMQQGMMQPGMMQPGMMQPGMMPGMAPPMGGNPMMAMMQMMQMMMGGGAVGGVDPSAVPFTTGTVQPDGDAGLDAEIICPATLSDLLKTQEAVPMGSVLDLLCLTEDGQHALGGVPKGCTMAFVGPPGRGKTRTALAGLARVALSGMKVALVVAEEGFHDAEGSGRDDLCSRMVKIGMAATGLSEPDFVKKVLENVFVLESQYHKGQSWDDFVTKYRYLVEKEEIDFVIIDSLNTLDPTRSRTSDNLSALKTYNHERGVTCLCIGQIKDTGMPVGGEALQHTADAVFLIEELSLGSKEMASKWGGAYRDKIAVMRVVKSVTTPTFPHLIRITQEEQSGCLAVHEAQPEEYAVLPVKG